jgi:hypothetical protein
MSDEKKVDPAKMRFIEAKAREVGTVTGAKIDERYGFALLIFGFDTPELTYVSNAEREDMRKMLRELLDRWERNDWSEYVGGIDAQN